MKFIVPMPGARRIAHVGQNVAAASISPSPEEVETLGDMLAPEKFAGERYGYAAGWGAKR